MLIHFRHTGKIDAVEFLAHNISLVQNRLLRARTLQLTLATIAPVRARKITVQKLCIQKLKKCVFI